MNFPLDKLLIRVIPRLQKTSFQSLDTGRFFITGHERDLMQARAAHLSRKKIEPGKRRKSHARKNGNLRWCVIPARLAVGSAPNDMCASAGPPRGLRRKNKVELDPNYEDRGEFSSTGRVYEKEEEEFVNSSRDKCTYSRKYRWYRVTIR